MSENIHAVVIAMGMRYRKVDRIADWQFVAVSRGLVHATASAAAGGMDFVLDYIEAPLPRGNGLWLLPVISANRLDITKAGPWRRLTQCELSMVADGTFGKWMPGEGDSAMTTATRTDFDAKLDAIERIIRQVRRHDGAQAADLIVYGKVPIKDLAWTELEPEEIASAAMGGVTEGDEFRPGLPSAELRAAWSQWEARDDYGRVAAIELDHRSRPGWMRAATGAAWVHIELYGFHQRSWRPFGKTWSQIESLAGGEGRR